MTTGTMTRKMLQRLAFACLCLGGVAYGDGLYEEIGGIKWYYSVTNGEATITQIWSALDANSPTGDLNVPGTLGEAPVVAIARYVICPYGRNEGLTSVTFPDSLKVIEEGNFSECTSLKSVTFGSGMTNLGAAFLGCTAIDSFIVPEGNPNLSAEGSILYSKDKTVLVRYPSASGEFEIPDSVTAIGEYAFANSLLTDVKFPSGLKEIRDRAFCAVVGLESADLPEGLTFLGENAFSDCSGLASAYVPSTLGLIGEAAFLDCTNLSSVTIGDGVRDIGKTAFSYCIKLPKIEIPNSVTNIGGSAFQYCESLWDVTIGSGVTKIGNSLGELAFDAWGIPYRDDAASAFGGCDSLMDFKLAEGNPVFEEIGGCLFLRDTPKTAKTLAVYPSGREDLYFTGDVNVTKIGEAACSQCNKFNAVDITNSVRDIGTQGFLACNNLRTVIVNPGVTNIDYGAFMLNMELVDVEIAGTVKTIGENAFMHDYMSGAGLPGRLVLHEGIEEIGTGAFSKMRDLVEVEVPDSVTKLGVGAFMESWGLSNIVFGAGIAALPDSLFDGDYMLESVTMKGAVSNIGEGAFSGCNELSKVVFCKADEPDASTADWPAEATVYIPDTALDWNVQDGKWNGMTVVYYSADVPPPVDPDGIAINTESSYTTESDGTFTLVVPIESATTPTVKVTGLPSGITFTAKTLTISGKAKAPVVATVTVSATNAKVKTPVTATFTLTVPNFTTDTFKDAGLDTDGKYVLGAGAAPDLSGVIQNIKAGGWKLAVAGLPAGLKYDDKNSAITGVATKEGVFTVTFTATQGKTKEIATATFEVVFPTLALDIAAYGEDASATNKAKVVGGGKYPVGAKVTLKATPDKGKVFAGWFDAEGKPLAGAADYRTASYAYVATDADVTLTAKFATSEEDIASLKVTLSDAKTDDDGTYELDLGACVESASLPKLAVKGLPTGLKFDTKTLKITGKATKPGVYPVKVEATNTSVKKATDASTGEFELKVPNFTTEMFKAAGLDTDGKYVLAAGVLPDDITNVVNAVVAEGWTLKVDGLPAGVKFDAKKNVFTGVATKEGFFTVTFTATQGKTKEIATATFEVAFPTLTLEIAAYDDETATNKCKVAGGGKYAAGAKVTLKATPDKGKVFAGWYGLVNTACCGMPPSYAIGLLSQSPSYAYIATEQDMTITAKFATEDEDKASLKVEVSDDTTDADGTYELDLGACVESLSIPKLAVKGLPTGLKFDAKTGLVTGKATKPGVYAVKVEATNTSVKKATDDSTGEFMLTVPNKTSAALPKLKDATDAYGTNFAGVAFDPELVDCTPAEGWTVKVAGLPTGLKYDAKTGKITGVSTAKAGAYTVTFTATQGKAKEEATITLNVDALPDWAVGTFDGATDDGGGIVQALTIAANGKISGKVLEGGNTWTLSAASFDSYDAVSGAYLATVVGKNGKLLATNFVAITEGADGTGVASCDEWTAYQNLWKRADTKGSMPVFKKNFDVETDNGLKLTFKKDGAVTFAGAVDGAKVSGSSQLVWNGEGWKVTLYAPPTKTFDGYCETCAVTLTLDDANVVAAADVQAGAEPPPAWGVGHYVGYGQVEHPPATLNGPSEYLWGMVYVDVAEDFSFTGSFAPFSGSPAPFSGKMYRVQVSEDIFGYLADDVAISVNGDDALLHFQFITMGFGKMGVQSTQCTPGITGISFFDVLHNPWGNAALASEISTFAPGASKTINLKDYSFYDSTEGDYVDGDSLTFQFAADGTVTITGQIFGAGVNSTTTIGVNDTIDDGAKFDCHVTFAANGRIYQLMVEIPSSGTVTSDDIALYYDPDFPTDPNYHFGLINGW